MRHVGTTYDRIRAKQRAKRTERFALRLDRMLRVDVAREARVGVSEDPLSQGQRHVRLSEQGGQRDPQGVEHAIVPPLVHG